MSVSLEGRSLAVRWDIAPESLSDVSDDAATAGLTLRLFTVALKPHLSSPGHTIDHQTRDVRLPAGEHSGVQLLGKPPKGAHVTCAVGVLLADGFVSLAHCPRLQIES